MTPSTENKWQKRDQSLVSYLIQSSVNGQNDQLRLTHTTVHQILTNDLEMTKICTQIFQKFGHKIKRTTRGTGVFLEQIENVPCFFKCIITGDDSQIFEYNSETKRQSHEWQTSVSSRKKRKNEQAKIKSIFICFFDSQGILW